MSRKRKIVKTNTAGKVSVFGVIVSEYRQFLSSEMDCWNFEFIEEDSECKCENGLEKIDGRHEEIGEDENSREKIYTAQKVKFSIKDFFSKWD